MKKSQLPSALKFATLLGLAVASVLGCGSAATPGTLASGGGPSLVVGGGGAPAASGGGTDVAGDTSASSAMPNGGVSGGAGGSGGTSDGVGGSGGGSVELAAVAPPGRVALGGWAACAVGQDGLAQCWGLPHHDGNGGNRNRAPANLKASYLSGCHHGACAIVGDPKTPSDAITCWGADLGLVPPPAVKDSVQITSGYFHSCALARDGAVSCWRGGDEAVVAPDSVFAVPPGLLARALCSCTYNCAITSDNLVTCWGDGAPQAPSGLKAKAIACGGWYEYNINARHACAIQEDDTVTCWGDKDGGALDVPTVLKATSVAAGNQSSCAVQFDGHVVCWGTLMGSAVPEGLKATSVYMTHETAAAVSMDGRVVVWGELRAPTPEIYVPQ